MSEQRLETGAFFKATIRPGGAMVAGVAVVGGVKGRLFVRRRRESPEVFVGRVVGWIKEAGGAGVQMMSPEVLPEGAPLGEVLAGLKQRLGIPGGVEADEYDLQNVEILGEGGKLS